MSKHGPRRQLSFALVDQFVSSGSNILFLLIVAAVSDSTSFGEFSAAYSLFILVGGFSRAIVTDPLLIASPGEIANPSEHFSGILSAAVLTGLAGGLTVLASTPFFTDPLLPVAMAVFLPALVAQDAYRSLSFYEHRADRALLQDLAWVGAQLALTGIVALLGNLTAITATIAWGVGGLVSAAISGAWTQVLPGPGALTWIKLRLHRSTGMAIEFISGQGSLQASLLAVAAVVGPAALGSIRIAMLALSPLNVLAQGLYGWAMPRLAARQPSDRFRFGLTLASFLGAVALVVSLTLLVLPGDWLVKVFGDTWTSVTAIVLVMVAVDRVCAVAGLPLSWTARAHGRTRALAYARVGSGVIMVLGATTLASAAGVTGAAAGIAAASALALGLCFHFARPT